MHEIEVAAFPEAVLGLCRIAQMSGDPSRMASLGRQWRRRPHHRVYQVLEHARWILAASGMRGRHLNDRASRCNQPMKAFALSESADRSRIRPTRANSGNAVGMSLYRFDVQAGI